MKHRKRAYLTENQVQSALENFVRNVMLPDEVIKLIIKGLKHRGMKASRITSTKKQNLEAEKQEISKKLSKMLDMQLDGKVANEEIFTLKQKELTNKLADISQELTHCVDNPEETVKRAVNTLEMVSQLETRFKQANNHERAQLLRLLTDSLMVSTENHITPQYREPFQTLINVKSELNLAGNMPLKVGSSDGKGCIINQEGG